MKLGDILPDYNIYSNQCVNIILHRYLNTIYEITFDTRSCDIKSYFIVLEIEAPFLVVDIMTITTK